MDIVLALLRDFLLFIPVANQLDLIYVSKGTFSQALTKDCSDGHPFIHLRKLAMANIHLLKKRNSMAHISIHSFKFFPGSNRKNGNGGHGQVRGLPVGGG